METCPPIVEPPELSEAAARTFRWYSIAAIATWVVCAIWPLSRLVAGTFPARAAALYFVAFAAYGAAMLYIMWLPGRERPVARAVPVTLALVETATAMLMNLMTLRYIHGTGAGVGLIVIVAAQLPYLLTAPWVWTWVAAQTVLLAALFLPADVEDSMVLALAVGGFQIFAAASTFLAISEGRARTNLARANAELHATRSLLAESSRAEERLRIARDLHDTLGHHLTALSLQLDVASRLADGRAAEHLQQAHAIARLLLSDVRDVVSRTRDPSTVDVASAVTEMAGKTLGVAVHVDMPADFRVDDADQADALVKSIREIITNTVRHAGAKTLTLDLRRAGHEIVVNARDDGSGAAHVWWGNGLTGMRERFEQFGGIVEVHTGAGRGFEIRGAMPVRSAP